MRRGNLSGTFAFVVCATMFIPGLVARAQADGHRECSTRRLEGGFGFTSTGTLLNLPAPLSGPFGEVGQQTFDGHGNTAGIATLSANGNIVRVTFQGTYAVNEDCTGSMTVVVSPFGSTVSLDFVIDDDGGELRAIVTGTGAVETRVYRKQFTRGGED